MSTNLAAQLRQLAVPATNILKDDKKRVSLLFDSKEAASISGKFIHLIGLEGLGHLISRNDSFEEFRDSLYSKSAQKFDRNVHGKDDNNKLDKNIKRFLVMVAPYLLTNPAHKALEWLYYRFSIHEYNKKDLILMALPYYSSNIFCRIIQTLHFNDSESNDPFYFLKTVKKSGLPLARLDLFYQVRTNSFIVKLIAKFMTQLMDTHADHEALTAQFNFYCTTFCGALENTSEVSESFLSQMLPLLLKGLNSHITDFAAASYVITAKLLSKGPLADKLLNKFLEKICDLNCGTLKKEAALLVVLIYQLQKQYSELPSAAMENLLNGGWIVESLQHLHNNGNYVYDCLKILVKKVACQAVCENDPSAKKFILDIMGTMKFDGFFVNTFLCVLLDAVDENTMAQTEINEWLSSIIKKLELSYPADLDAAVGEILKQNHTATKRAFLKAIFEKANQSYAANFQLIHSLFDEQEEINEETVKSILALLGGRNMKHSKFIQASLIDLFKDPKLLDRKWEKSYILAAKLLLNKEEFSWDMFIAMFPFIVVYSKRQLNEMKKILKLKFFTESKIFSNVDSATCETPEQLVKALLSRLETNADIELFEDLLKYVSYLQEPTCIRQYCGIVILSYMFPHISLMHSHSIEQFFKIINNIDWKPSKVSSQGSKLHGYLEIALNNKIPLNGIRNCINKVIIRATDNNINFTESSAGIQLLNSIISLCFSNSLLGNSFDSYLNRVCENTEEQMKVSLSICASGVIHEDHVCSILKCIHQKVMQDAKIQLSLSEDTSLYLLVLLSKTNSEIRRLTFKLTEHLLGYCNDRDLTYEWLLQQLLSYKEEIIADEEQLSLVCFNLLTSDTSKNVAKDVLLNAVCGMDAPMYVKAGLLKILSHINDFTMVKRLCQHFLELFENKSDFNVYEITVLTSLINRLDLNVMAQVTVDSPIWSFITFVLNNKKVIIVNSEKSYLPSIVLNQFSKDVYAVLPENLLGTFLDTICEVAVSFEDPEFLSSSSKIFKHIDLNAKTITRLLKEMAEVQSNKSKSSKNRRNTIPTADILDTMSWKKGVCVLEFIQGKKKIRNVKHLLPLLFDILKKCLDFEEQAAVEYPKQLTLSLILLVCNKLEDDSEDISANDFNVELVIQCIRASQNPQTHYHALLVLAHAAKFVPSEVLHHVMAVFTFMGSTLIRHDDAYSFEIISKIIDTVIPILVSGKDQSHTVTMLNVLEVFVDALLDVPEHRRIPLYRQLIYKINIEENFPLFLLLVLEAEVFQTTREKKKVDKGKVMSERIKIALELCQEFTPEIIIRACMKLSKYIIDLPDQKDDNMKISPVKNNQIDLNKFNAKQFRHYKYLIVTFLCSLLSSEKFVNSVSVLSDQDNINMESLYKEVIINVLAYIQKVQKICDRETNSPQSLYWKTLLYHSYDLLDNVNDLLTPHMFLLVIKGLLVHSLVTVKRRALELLNNKLQYNLSSFKERDTAELYILIQPIILIIEKIKEDNLSTDQETLIQTALLSLKLIVKTLGPQDPEKFVPVLEFVTSTLKVIKSQNNVLASVVLCLAELCTVLRSHAISSLNSFMPAFLNILKKQKHQETSNLLLLSVITAVSKLLESFAAFLSPYLEKIVYEVSILNSNWGCSAEDPKSQALVTRLNGIKKKLGTVIPPRILIPTVDGCYDTLLSRKHYSALSALVDLLEEQLSELQTNEIAANMGELTNFFVKTLQFRCDFSDVALETANKVEDQVVKTLTVFILKLSESTFRPFYLRLYDWAVRSGYNKERLITFYHLSESIGHALKGLFTLFAGNIIGNLSEILRTITSSEEDISDKDKIILLLENVLKTLHVIFTHDNKKLINRERFEMIMQPLVDLLEKDIDGIERLVQRNEKLITPTIVQFAFAVADDTLWKEMNYQILLKMRSQIPEIRLGALHCLTEVVSKLRDDFLPLLPETIPFLAELLEDEDERVERSCQKTIREMEKVLGEPLQKYF